MIDGNQQAVTGAYKTASNGQVAFNVGQYDKTKALVIDPILEYSTNFAPNGPAYPCGIAVDSSGCAYITGHAGVTDFPTTPDAYQTTFGYLPSDKEPFNGFVTKLTADGSALVYSTYFGGANSVAGEAIAVDSYDCAYVKGYGLTIWTRLC